jgi:hypothetical protein
MYAMDPTRQRETERWAAPIEGTPMTDPLTDFSLFNDAGSS